MCQFLSALVLRNGDVLTHPILDSHADLVRHFKLPDTHAHHQHFAKVELTPVEWMDVSTWQFRLDEESAPGWWDDVKDRVEATLRSRANAMILRDGDHSLLLDGCWIVGGTAKIRDVRSGRIVRLQDTGSITDVWGGIITDVYGGSITDVWGGSITAVYGGSITDVWGGSITDVRGSATLDASAQASVAVVPDTSATKKRAVTK
jgi:hypothetical protein